DIRIGWRFARPAGCRLIAYAFGRDAEIALRPCDEFLHLLNHLLFALAGYHAPVEHEIAVVGDDIVGHAAIAAGDRHAGGPDERMGSFAHDFPVIFLDEAEKARGI